MREERASTPRAGPRPDFRAYGAQGRLSTSGNRVSRPGPRPRAGTGWLQAPQRSQHHHLSKGLDNKRRAGAEKWGRGYSKYSKSFLRRGCVLLSPASSFCEFLEVTPELAPDAPKALTTHTAAEAFIHTSALRSRYTEARTAPPLFLPNSQSDGANRGERGSPAPLPWKSRCSHRQQPPLSHSFSPFSPRRSVPARRCNKFERAARSNPGYQDCGDGAG